MKRMHPSSTFWLRIALACVILALSGMMPYPSVVRQGFQDAHSAMQAGKPELAAKALRRVVEAQPWRKELWQIAGQDALAAQDPKAAIVALERARVEQAITADGLIALGDAYLQERNLPSAMRAWKDAVRTGMPAEEAFEKMYFQQREQGDLIGARLTLQEWLARNPNSVEPLYQSGLLLAVLDPERAIPVLLDAAGRSPDLSSRVETLRKGLNLAVASGDPVAARLQVGRSLSTLGEWRLAQVCFEEATVLDPGYAEAWAFLGEARQQMQQDGYPDLERAAGLAPDSVVVQALFSVYYRRQGQPERAVAYLEKIAAQEPDQALWQMEMGNALSESGDLVAALPHYLQAVALEPASPMYWAELARFSITNNHDVRGVALPAAREALQLAPKDPVVLDLNGQVMYNLGDMASAERFLQRALEIDSSNASAHLHLGQVYVQWQRMEQAQVHLSAAVKLNGDGPVGMIARRLLDRFFANQSTPEP